MCQSAAHLHISSASPEQSGPIPLTVCGESVHTMQMHNRITHVPLHGSGLGKKIQHCVLVTKHSLVGYTILTRWRGPLDFLSLFFLPHLWNQDDSYLNICWCLRYLYLWNVWTSLYESCKPIKLLEKNCLLGIEPVCYCFDDKCTHCNLLCSRFLLYLQATETIAEVFLIYTYSKDKYYAD